MFILGTKAVEVFVRVLTKVKDVIILSKQPLIDMSVKSAFDIIKKRKQDKDGKKA